MTARYSRLNTAEPMDQQQSSSPTDNDLHSHTTSKAYEGQDSKAQSWRYQVFHKHRRRAIVVAALLSAGVIAAIIAGVVKYTQKEHQKGLSARELHADVTTWYRNDLHGRSSPNKDGAILLNGRGTRNDVMKNCSALGEGLLNPKSLDPAPLLSYITFLDNNTSQDLYWVANTTADCKALSRSGEVSTVDCNRELQGLCSSNAPVANIADSDNSEQWQIHVETQDQTWKGYRDRRSFRFLGIRYGNKPARFEHSTLFEESGSYDAVRYASACMQPGEGDLSEDCLFLNVWTPFLPRDGNSSTSLKPVMYWMHGGAFEVDTGSDPTFDGGNLASRGDVVVVVVNYRLGNLGFLPVNDTSATGNYGFGDMVTGLDWVQKHIADFGGDPKRVTIAGQSAGAASVRAMLGSPKAAGKFSAAIMQSPLGGYDFARSYSEYMSIDEAQANFTNNIIDGVGCGGRTPLSCLQKTDPHTLLGVQQASFLVKDDVYITERQILLNDTKSTASVPVIMGTMQGDAVFFLKEAPENQTDLDAALDNHAWTKSVVHSPKSFPLLQTGSNTTNIYNITVQAGNDGMFRCVDQATAHSGVKNKVFPNVWYYEMQRSYIDYPSRPACNAPVGPGFPFGDPANQTYQCHTGDTIYTFGNVGWAEKPDRDGQDYLFAQLMADYWTSFMWNHDPNPDVEYLKARGYVDTLNATLDSRWAPVSAATPSKRLLRAHNNSTDVGFNEIEQCKDIDLPIDMFD